MTVVCYKDGILAADSQMSAGDAIVTLSFKKLAKGPGVIGGFSGRANNIPTYRKWVKKGAKKKDIPSKNTDGMIIRGTKKDPKIYIVDDGLLIRIYDKTHAVGSGANVALGAMSAGASAQEAVRITMKHNHSCGGKVMTVTL